MVVRAHRHQRMAGRLHRQPLRELPQGARTLLGAASPLRLRHLHGPSPLQLAVPPGKRKEGEHRPPPGVFPGHRELRRRPRAERQRPLPHGPGRTGRALRRRQGGVPHPPHRPGLPARRHRAGAPPAVALRGHASRHGLPSPRPPHAEPRPVARLCPPGRAHAGTGAAVRPQRPPHRHRMGPARRRLLRPRVERAHQGLLPAALATLLRRPQRP